MKKTSETMKILEKLASFPKIYPENTEIPDFT